MEASHKTHRPHIKVGTDEEEEEEEVCHIIQACCVFSLSQSTRRNHLIAFNIRMHIVNTAADGSYSMTEVAGDSQLTNIAGKPFCSFVCTRQATRVTHHI